MSSETAAHSMTRIIALSSQVVRGNIGLSAICPTMAILGVDTLALPTTLLSNHPGHPHSAKAPVAVSDLRTVIAALRKNNWLDVDAVLTGYLPTAEHVAFAIETIEVIQSANLKRDIQIICDPVIGDDPKGRYIDQTAAVAIRSELLPRAHIVTPNRFELAFLAQCDVRSCADAVAAARTLKIPYVIATSIFDPLIGTVNMSISATETHIAAFQMQSAVPNGTGDTFAAIFCAHHIARAAPPCVAMGHATAALSSLVKASIGQPELAIVSAQNLWRDTQSADVTLWTSSANI